MFDGFFLTKFPLVAHALRPLSVLLCLAALPLHFKMPSRCRGSSYSLALVVGTSLRRSRWHPVAKRCVRRCDCTTLSLAMNGLPLLRFNKLEERTQPLLHRGRGHRMKGSEGRAVVMQPLQLPSLPKYPHKISLRCRRASER
ncbi:hypothetical protein TRVL_05425 [Trypanosoma vivax]|nr:hypothetical protein TRVL_05425 [Trypanosoma vivax]